METRSNHRQRQKPRRFHWGRLIGLILVVGLFTVGAYALRLYSQAKYAIDNTYHATKHVSTDIAQRTICCFATGGWREGQTDGLKR